MPAKEPFLELMELMERLEKRLKRIEQEYEEAQMLLGDMRALVTHPEQVAGWEKLLEHARTFLQHKE